nr:hypothetical protein [Tanacetum cinerariifolium]
MSDMTALLNDLSYIPSNNKHNEPTQGDIGETSNELTQATRNEFEELYASTNEELYHGCDYVTLLDFMAKFTYFKVKGKDIYVYLRPLIKDLKGTKKKFCQFIKGVKLPDGFGSCFKHKVTDKDTNITGLKSHDCHIMMQRLLPYGLQQYLPDKFAKLIIKLCSLFKKIYSETLMEDDMLKAQIKVVDILCDLELIYHLALFDIMIHLVIHLPLEDLEGGPIRPQWMFPFERYTKKLKGYDVTTKFNRPGHNVDLAPQRISFRCSNCPEIDTYRSQFKSLFPNKDMKEEFPDWFGSQICQCHVDNDKDTKISTTSDLFALAYRQTWTPILVNSCVVDGVRYVVNNRDECRTTQNSGICSPGPDREMYYGQLQEILEFKGEAFKNDKYILVTEVKQVFYLKDKAKSHWKVVEHVNHKKFSNGGIIVVEDDPDIIYFDNSSDLPLSASLNDLDNATLHIDGQSTEVDAPPDIIDVPDEDDDIINDEDVLPHDLADFDDEDLINVDDDGVNKMSVDVARSYGGDGGGVDRPPPHHVPTGYEGCFANRGKVNESLIWSARQRQAAYPRQDPKPLIKGNHR